MPIEPTHRPEFVDNRDGNTLAAALTAHLQWLANNLRQPTQVSIASGYFNPEGFGRLADSLERCGAVRLLLGAEPVPPPARPVRHLGEPFGERFEAKLIRSALAQTEEGLRRDRDHLAFTPATDNSIRRLLAFLESGKIEVRRYERRFLHGKAYIFGDGQGVIAGSSNFTAAGLSSNLELNLGHYQPSVTQRVEEWFESLWADAAPYDLAALYEPRFEEYSPYLIYLRVLWERYKDELELERTPGGTIHLTRFQSDGLDRARRILDKYNGVLIADSVGLGKTFLAGELLRDTIERERKRALLIAPAALRDGTWARFKDRFQLGVEVKSFEQVADDKQLGGMLDALNSPIDQYSLIIIDEAHAFRNPDTRRAAALRRLLQGDPPKQVVLMSATPVNNGLWDLYNLLIYFVGHDSVFADAGIVSLRRRFEEAVKQDPFTLSPAVLFDVLDATTVRRTRHFVQRYYPNDRIELRGGERVTIQFPRPHVAKRSYDLESALPGLLDDFAEVLAPEEGEPRLTMARYWPTKYRRDGKPDAREVALVGLIRSGLLKRFESSAHAFANTLDRMVRAHDALLTALDRGVIPGPEVLTALVETDSDETWDELLEDAEALDATEYDIAALRKAVRGDRAILLSFHERAAAVTRPDDPKLALLVEELAEIASHAEKHGVSETDIRNRRKVLVFSYFADSVEWIVEHLKTVLVTDRRLAAYRGRLAAVRGTEGYDGVGRREAVYGFAPESSEAPPAHTADLYDILVTTDVLAEGMNLQQASRIINYDLPWNPMRLVQRHGRIDRIGSPHSDVWLTCIFPDEQLDKLLSLEKKIRVKLAQASASVGLDSEVLPGIEVADRNFEDTKGEIERLRQGDATLFETAGEDVHAHSGEEYRQELRKAISDGMEAQIRDLPGAAGSGLRLGPERGHFFCAKVDDRVLLRFVPLAAARPISRDALDCLRRITCAPGTERVVPEDLHVQAYGAWERARRDIFDEWQKGTDPRNLAAPIRPLFKHAAVHVRANRPEEMSAEDESRLCEALEAPRGMREERALRKVFTVATAQGERTTRAIRDFVKEWGFQPWTPPRALDPIAIDEVQLVVWMAVEAA
jgi:hypothetical protein